MELIPRYPKAQPETIEQIATKTAMKRLRQSSGLDEVTYNRLLAQLWEVIIVDLYRLVDKETILLPYCQDWRREFKRLLDERPINTVAIQCSIEEEGMGHLVEAIVKGHLRFYLASWRQTLGIEAHRAG